MYWYVLFVQTGREHKAEKFLKERLDVELFTPFVPLQEVLFKKAGTIQKELKPLFPGYVFIESELTSHEFLNRTSTLIYNSQVIVSLLRYSDTEIAMRESDKQMLLRLSNHEHCIESSSGIIEGDRIRIIDGPLKGCENLIRRINRHKRCVEIEMNFFGQTRKINLSLEIISKISYSEDVES